MFSLFRKNEKGQTVLLLDVDSASVGAALARCEPGVQPKLFGERRVFAPLANTYDAGSLLRAVEAAAREALAETSLVAARVRMNKSAGRIGAVSRAEVFLHAPWVDVSFGPVRSQTSNGITGSGLSAAAPERLTRALRAGVEEFFGAIPVSFHAFGAAAVLGVYNVFNAPCALAFSTNGEVTELNLGAQGSLIGRATIPLGTRSLVRTLKSHAGLSESEALSALRMPARFEEPLRAFAVQFVEMFADAAGDLLDMAPTYSVVTLGGEPVAEWLGNLIAENKHAAAILPTGGSVRALLPHHLVPHIIAHADTPDMALMLEGLVI